MEYTCISSLLTKSKKQLITSLLFLTYKLILGGAVIYLIFLGISKTLPREGTPRVFIYGVTARVIAPPFLDGSATISGVVNGSKFLSTHSTEAKKLFKSIHKIFLSFILTPPFVCIKYNIFLFVWSITNIWN